jgi:asparagine synthase (glutamine-hydrolysing)
VSIHRLGREAVYYSWSPDTDTAPLQENDERGIIEQICKQEGITCLYHRRPDSPAEAVARLKEDPPTESYFSMFIEGAQRFAQAGARIAFSGWGGDEGVSHRAHMTEMLLHGEPLAYLREVLYRVHGQPVQFVKLLVGHLRFLRNRKKPWDGFKTNRAAGRTGLNHTLITRMEPKIHKEPLWFNTHPIRQIEQGGNRARMELAAREGAQHNVQYVFPYLDYRLEDFAVSIPRWLYNHKGENRYIYRRAFAEIMPADLTRLTDKSDAGRTTPLINQSSAVLDGIGTYALARLNRDYWQRYLDFDEWQGILADNRQGKLQPFAVLHATQQLAQCCYLQRVMDSRDTAKHALNESP